MRKEFDNCLCQNLVLIITIAETPTFYMYGL